MDIQITPVFLANKEALMDPNVRVVCNQGGTRSSKTWSVLQLIILDLCQNNRGLVISIVRKHFSTMKKSVMRDFFDQLNAYGMYDVTKHNKTDYTYNLNGNLIEFFGLDTSIKVAGSKRDLLYINEANELNPRDWQQLILRTGWKAVIDYNPIDEFHWIYDAIVPRKDTEVILSSYLDNPTLDEQVKKEIELLKDTDPEAWKVFGLGERATASNRIYPAFDLCDDLDGEPDYYGLDWGFHHPTAVVGCKDFDGEIRVQEVLYQSLLTPTDVVKMLIDLGVSKDKPIYCDHARKEGIEELRRAGFNALMAKKDVVDGIMFVKGRSNKEAGLHVLKVTKDSANLIKEMRTYSWRIDKEGNRMDEPVKINDDAVDAMRYAIYTHHQKPQVDENALDAMIFGQFA